MDLRDVFRPGSGLTPALVFRLVLELPDWTNTVASIRASAPPKAKETEVVAKLRTRRDFNGWGMDRIILARISAGLGNPIPSPFDDGPGGRQEATFDDLGI